MALFPAFEDELLSHHHTYIHQTRNTNQETKLIPPWLVGLKDAMQFSSQTQIRFNVFSSAHDALQVNTEDINYYYTERCVCSLVFRL